ncbi:AMP-binding protein [Humibacter soli]
MPFRGSTEVVVERLRAVRAAGDIPLVGDERWPEAQWDAVQALCARARPSQEAAWATLTSGTSGAPRLLTRSAASWQASFGAVSELLGASDRDAIVLPAPSSSSLTLFSLAHALGGGPQPVFPRIDPQGARVATAFHGTPEGLDAMLDADAIPGVRTALVGGSRLDERVRSRAEGRGIHVIAYYGAAELSFVALDDGDGLRPFPGVELEVRDGVLWARSPYLALGYLGDGGPMRRDGDWATVGDLAELADGRLRLRGRADGAIITASATVVPEEVEQALRRLPGVRNAVVFAYPATGVGSLVAAMIEQDSEEARMDAGVLRRASAELLAPAHRPRLWFSGELPRTPSGKPARAEVARRVLAGEVDRVG